MTEIGRRRWVAERDPYPMLFAENYIERRRFMTQWVISPLLCGWVEIVVVNN